MYSHLSAVTGTQMTFSVFLPANEPGARLPVTHLLHEACDKAGESATIQIQKTYDHAHHFVSRFMTEHVGWHAARTRA